MAQRRLVSTSSGLASLLLVVACGSAPQEGAPSARPVGGAEAQSSGAEASVRPGVNDRYYEEGALEKWSGVFEAESREVVRHRDAIVAASRIEPGMRVADLGAGTGLFALQLARAVGPEGAVHAVEIVPSFLARLRQLAATTGVPNIRVVEGQVQSTGLDDASVDLALLINVYHHLEYPKSYMQSVMGSLRPGGRLVVVDFHRIEGVTSESMLKHVRADQQTVRAEIEAVGFVFTREERFMQENYFMELRRP